MIKTVTEWCPLCDQEVELKEEFTAQECPNCKDIILPCNQCVKMDCLNCPLEGIREEMNKIHTVFIGYDIPEALEVKCEILMPVFNHLYKRIEIEGDKAHIVPSPEDVARISEMVTVLNEYYDFNLTVDWEIWTKEDLKLIL